MKNKSITTFLFLLGIFFQANAQENKRSLSVEIDPVSFYESGYSLHLRYKPLHSNQFLIGIGTYAMNMPDALVGLNQDNKDKGWNVRLNQGNGVFSEYYLKEVNKKTFLGIQASIQEYEIKNVTIAGSSTFKNFLGIMYGGYTLQPFKFPAYIKFWGGLGYTNKISGKNTLENLNYSISPIAMFATVHLGYTFLKNKD